MGRGRDVCGQMRDTPLVKAVGVDKIPCARLWLDASRIPIAQPDSNGVRTHWAASHADEWSGTLGVRRGGRQRGNDVMTS